MINPQCIEVFLAIIEHKSISSVARLSHFSQPTISEYLNQLEHVVGTTLVLRGKGHRQITLTPAGEAFLPLARQWMKHQKELEIQIRQFSQSQPHNVLRLAASSGAHQTVVSNIIHKLIARRPGINLQLCNVERREMLSAIETFTFDIAFMYQETPEHDLITDIPIFKEQQYILCPADTQLPNGVISPQDLDPQFEITYVAHNSSKSFQDWHQSCFPEMGPGSGESTFEVSSLASAHNYLTDSRSWTVVPASIAMSNISQKVDKLTFRRIEPEPPPRFCSVLISKSYREEKVVRDFLNCCEEFIEERSYLKKLPWENYKIY